MKKIALIFPLALIAFTLSAQRTLYLSKPLSKEMIKEVEVKTTGGGIALKGGFVQDARIEVYVSSNGREINWSKAEIQAKLDQDYDLSLVVENNKLRAIAKPKERNMNWRRALNISFDIYVPQNVSSDLSTSGGSISLDNLTGTEEFRTSGGSLTVGNLSGRIFGKTSGGSIHVSDSREDIDLGTSGGSIDATNCTGKIRLNTSGGSLSLQGLKGNIQATTSGGSVNGKEISGELVTSTSGGSVDLYALSCSLEASTSGGSITAELKDLGKYVRLHNSGGNIDLQLPRDKGYDLRLYGGRINTETFSGFSGTIKEKRIEGVLHGGGVEVVADAGSGRINLSFR
jgi:DUF4097 and DUF4098 domain-containing protein YvlB